MKKVAIIGGGITGCVTALQLTKYNCKINLYEKSNLLGGILKDYKKNDKFFFSGPQYIDSSKWIDDLYEFHGFNKVLKKIDYVFGSYTDLFGKEIISSSYAHPITDKKFIKIKDLNSTSLYKRLKKYQKDISIPLIEWCNKFGNNLKLLHEECHYAMQVGRIFFSKDSIKTSALKKKSIIADNLLGIPNKRKYQSAYIPKNNFNEFFIMLKKHLIKKGVKFHQNEIVRIKEKEKTIYFGKKKIESDYFVWACNPVPLINYSGLGKLDNLTVKMVTHFFDIKLVRKLKNDAYYQIFCKNKNINRLYIYNIKNKIKLNVECFYLRNENYKNSLNQDIIKFLRKFGHVVKSTKHIGSRNELRHVLISENDNNIFKNFASNKKFKKFIPGSWEIYGRQKKIDKINHELNQRIFEKK